MERKLTQKVFRAYWKSRGITKLTKNLIIDLYNVKQWLNKLTDKEYQEIILVKKRQDS